MRRRIALSALAVIAFSACEQAPTEPAAEPFAPPLATPQMLADPASAEPAPQHLVFAKGNALRRVAAAVEAAGGEILFQHALGFVLASGLDESGAARVAGVRGVDELVADTWFDPGIELHSGPVQASPASPDNPAQAFFYPRQWHMEAIGAPTAWNAGRLGSPDVTIAILDTGIDYLYPDLQGRVDLSRSVSFVPIDDLFASIFFPERNPITDLHFHGTHVAATAVSNGFVAAGVTSQATLMGVKVCTFTNFTCSFGAVISGLLYAADNGADVINMSLGGGFSKAGNGRLVGFINRVFNYARRQGSTVVVSAGNAASDLDANGNFFASYCDAPGVICVSATGPTGFGSVNGPFFEVDAPAPYTNIGRSAITVAAPGGSALPVWAGCSTTSLLLSFCTEGVFIIGINGTSMAAPHVSGLAALVVEDVGARPGRVKSRIQQGADDLGPPGTDKAYGKGRINVGNTIVLR